MANVRQAFKVSCLAHRSLLWTEMLVLAKLVPCSKRNLVNVFLPC